MIQPEAMFLGNSLYRWSLAAGIMAGVFGSFLLIRHILLWRLEAMASLTETVLDDLLADVLKATRPFLVVLAGGLAGAWVLSKPEDLRVALRVGAWLVLYGQATLWALRAIRFLEAHGIQKRKEEEATGTAILAAAGFAARLVLWAIFLLLALGRLGVNVSGLVAGLGIGGLAVALAVQNILSDVFASLSILLDRPFAIGDFLIVGDVVGAVEHIGLKTTRIRSLSGEQIIISNSELLKSRIHNFKRMAERRVVFNFGVTYQTPRAALAGIGAALGAIVESQPGARFDRSHFKEFGESALIFETVYFLDDPDYNRYMDVQQAINLALLDHFDRNDISMAFPTRTLILEPPALRSVDLQPPG